MNDGSAGNSTLSQTQVDAYWQDGFVAARGVFDDADVARWCAECDRLWTSVDETNPRVQRRGHGKNGDIADRLDPVMDLSPEFDRLARDPRATSVAAAAIGADVAILKAKLIMKRPGTMGYDLHQDYPYWDFIGVQADDIVIVVIPLDVSDAKSGAIEFFPRRHRERIAPPENDPLDTDPSLIDLSTGVCLALEPRDILLFHPLTPHRSGPNQSDHSRKALYYTYARSTHGNLYDRYYTDRPSYT
jgi:ectoine hydroxylase-related dioxygenase (phytanoyl-CoA dioxygenase family)